MNVCMHTHCDNILAIYIYIYIYIYIHYTHTHTCIHTYIHTYMYIYMQNLGKVETTIKLEKSEGGSKSLKV
jgi:hypothetical protein